MTVRWLLVSAAIFALFQAGLHRPAPHVLVMLGLLDRIPLFTVGIVAYRGLAAGGLVPRSYAIWLLCVAVSWLWSGPDSALVCGLTALVFALFVGGRLGWLAWRPLVWLGGISYTLYLVHQNIGYVVMRNMLGAGASTDAAIAATLVVSIALASALSYAIERPAMASLRAMFRARLSPAEAK